VSRGARVVAHLLAGAPASSVVLDDLDTDWRPLAEVLLDAPDRGAALELALAQRPDGQRRWAELLAADALDREAPDKPKRFRLVTPQGMKQLPRPRWQVDGVLHRNTLALLAGPEGTFKSFVALDLALSVAGGRPWQERGVHQGPVVYISAEGSAGVRNRLDAWETARQATAAETCYFIPDDAPQFLDGADVEALLEVVGELPTPPTLIVVDTLARCMVGGDENAAKDMGVFVAAADRLRQATGATVLLIHHHGKGGAVRGSTALVAAVDTILEAKRDGTLLTVSCGKQKDAAPFEPIHLVRRVVELGADAAGQPQSSLVLDPSGPPAADEDLPDLQQRVLAMLVDAFGAGGATDAQWRDLCLDEGVSRRSFYRAKKGLVEAKRVAAVDQGRRSAYLPGERVFGANGAKSVPDGAVAPTPPDGAAGATVPHSLRSGTAGTAATTGETTDRDDPANQAGGDLPWR
jgi:AAA domain